MYELTHTSVQALRFRACPDFSCVLVTPSIFHAKFGFHLSQVDEKQRSIHYICLHFSNGYYSLAYNDNEQMCSLDTCMFQFIK